MWSSLEFDMDDLKNDMQKNLILPRRPNFYDYIIEKIEKNGVDFLMGARASVQVVLETGMYHHRPEHIL